MDASFDVSSSLRAARIAAGLSQRGLARVAGTSQATVAAYETGRKQPSVATFARLLAACGARLTVSSATHGRSAEELALAGRRLRDVLELAEALPFRAQGQLGFPRLTVLR